MNISRNVKRLLVIIALSMVIIVVSKSLLSRAVKNLSVEAERKQLEKIGKLQTISPESAPAASSLLELSSSSVADGSINVLVESSPASVENASASGSIQTKPNSL
jgi:hypothetical protein